MKKIYLLIIMFFMGSFALASDEGSAIKQTWGENAEIFNKGFENQKAVSDTKLHKTIEMLKERSLSKKQKKIRAEVQPLSPSADMEHLSEFARSQSADDELSQTHTVMIPVAAYSEDGIFIQPGYYKLSCRRVDKDEYVLDLSQGNRRVLSVSAKQTQQDLEQDTITFCNAQIIDNGRIRLVYGSIDLNLVGYIYFK